MDKNKEEFHEVYGEHSKNVSRKKAVLTEIRISDQPKDFDGTNLGLEAHMYEMDGLPPIMMMVKKGKADCKIPAEAYGRVRALRHPNLLPIENYWSRGHGWYVVPCVGGTLRGWIRQDVLRMFQGDGQKKDLTPQFQTMIIELCSLFHKLSQKHLFPKTFGIWECYVIIVSGAPKIRVLLRDVEKRRFMLGDGAMTEKMKEFVTECCQIHHIELSDSSKNFISYTCDPIKAQHVEQVLGIPLYAFLNGYPDSWTFSQKECYLFNIVSGDHLPWHVIRSRANNSGKIDGLQNDDESRANNSEKIDWPRNVDESVVQELVDLNALGGKWAEKKDEYPFEYIQQCRNILKHFRKLPNAIKQALGGSPQGFIRKMEQWDAEIWRKLYLAYGPLVYRK